jgi:hypothetical protein
MNKSMSTQRRSRWLGHVGLNSRSMKVPGPGFNHNIDMKPKVLADLVSARIDTMSKGDEEGDGSLCYIKAWTEGT